jgi:hypothetical protein
MNCYICNKPLSDPISVKLGIGPDCRKSLGISGRNKENNIFGNRAEYSWGIDGKILWLKDNGQHCRSLTNDLENCLVEIQSQIDNLLIDYTIVYKDSDDGWDGVQITKFDKDKINRVDAEWVKAKGGQYHPQFLGIDFYFIGAKSFSECKERLKFPKTPIHLS